MAIGGSSSIGIIQEMGISHHPIITIFAPIQPMWLQSKHMIVGRILGQET